MSEPVFFAPPALPALLSELVTSTGSGVEEGVDLGIGISGAASLEEADRGDITFLDDPRFIGRLEATRASACFVAPRYRAHVPPTCSAILTETPKRAFALALAALFPPATRPSSAFGTSGTNPGAIIHPEARLEPGVIVDPGAVIGPRVEIGSASIIGACCVIGSEVRIGRECTIGAHVSISHALLGDRVILQPGARIGQDGFSFAAGPKGHTKIPHIGRVIVQDDVEIGANTTIDRGTIGDTIVGEGSKVGNQVQIASGVTIGRHCAIGAQAALGNNAGLGDAAKVGAKASLDPGASLEADEHVGKGAIVPRHDV
jgi:UDP-3-O-[3-hydroxymyristoyl] glucosamine N-acyltransferase